MHPCCITPAGARSSGPLSLRLSHAGRLSTSQPAARQLAVIGTLPRLSWERSEGLRSTTDGLPSPPIRESWGARWGWVGGRKGEEEKESTSPATLSLDQNGLWKSLFPLLPPSLLISLCRRRGVAVLRTASRESSSWGMEGCTSNSPSHPPPLLSWRLTAVQQQSVGHSR